MGKRGPQPGGANPYRKRDGKLKGTKRDPAKLEVLLNLIRIGIDKNTCAWAAGVEPKTLYNWINNDPKFAAEVEQASAQARASTINKIHKAADTDWKAAAWKAARLWPRWYSERQELSVMSEPDVDYSGLSLDEKRQLHGLMLKARNKRDESDE